MIPVICRRVLENSRSTGGAGAPHHLPNNQRGCVEASGGKNSQSSLSELRRSPQPTNTTTATTTTTAGSPEPQYTDPRSGRVFRESLCIFISSRMWWLITLAFESLDRKGSCLEMLLKEDVSPEFVNEPLV